MNHESGRIERGELPEQSLSVLKALSITIASDCTRMLSYFQDGYLVDLANKLFLPAHNYIYFEPVLSLTVHSINNILDSDYCDSVFEGYNSIRSSINQKSDGEPQDLETAETFKRILRIYETQILMPFTINYVYGT